VQLIARQQDTRRQACCLQLGQSQFSCGLMDKCNLTLPLKCLQWSDFSHKSVN
jgi:hypothetical protein